jgi:hypothetical protein
METNKAERLLMEKRAAQELLSSASGQGSSQSRIAPRAVQRALLLDDNTFASTLLLLVAEEYGSQFLPGTDPDGQVREGWDPETLKLTLERDFSLQLPKETLDKLLAAITLITTNFFWKDVTRFVELCNIFSGDDFQPDEFDPADAFELLWGLTESTIIYPPAGDDEDDAEDTEFSPEIRGYIGQVLQQEGITDPPDLLRLGQVTGGYSSTDEFMDDPELYQAILEAQAGKSDELRQMVRENLRQLAFQSRLLPLKTADKQAVLRQIEAAAAADPSPKGIP